MSACKSTGCRMPVGPGRAFWEPHWNQLPGRLRSRLSFSMRMRASPQRAELIRRAAAALQPKVS